MNKILCNLLCCFIPKKKNRQHFRKKYGAKKKDPLCDSHLLQEMKCDFETIKHDQETIKCDLEILKKIQQLSVDITKLPSATGNMKMVQDCSVALLNYFDKICKGHNIKYWIDSGTLIGYVRHNGFIPWDDDIDICIMRDDYERLFDILDNEFSQNGFKYARSEITRLYYKNTPAQVDIFPIDIGFQEEPLVGKEKEEFIALLNEIKSSIRCDYHTNLPLQQPVCSFEDISNALKQRVQLFKGKGPVSNGFLFYGIETGVKNRCLFDWDDVFPLKNASFLGIDTYIPNNTDFWLYSQYGDYMIFPSGFYTHSDIVGRLSADSYKNSQELINNHYPKKK